jgi:hypothetical protein
MRTPERGRTPHFPVARSRREFLQQAGGDFDALALAWLWQQDRARAATKPPVNPRAPKPPHFPARVERVIFLLRDPSLVHLGLALVNANEFISID